MKKYILPLLLISAAAQVNAQSVGPAVMNAAGGSANVGGNVHEYAVATEVLGPTSPSLLVTPGPLQPKNITSGIAGNTALLTMLDVFPNPAQTTLHLQPSLPAGTELSLTLADVAGKVVMRRSARLATGREEQTLNVAALATGTYLLTAQTRAAGKTAAAVETASFKIQKVQ